MRVHETKLRVRYAETDQMGVVYYANYLVYMEMGRVEYCRSAGLRYRDMEEGDGIFLAVAEAHCRYLAPARYDDELIIRTWVDEARLRMISFRYEIVHAETGRLLAKGGTKHVFCDRTMKPCKLPAKYHAMFGIGEGAG